MSGLPVLFLGLDFLDPEWLLERFGTEFLWVSVLIVFVECGLFFPFLPGDTLLFALGIFVATDQIDLFPGPRLLELAIVMAIMIAAGFLGNVSGYEIGRRMGPALYAREGRILRREYFDQTEAFFDKHGPKALVIGRFVAFVRTFITVVAGVTRMPRQRFFVWSFVGAVLWVLSITLIGYFLGKTVPWLGGNIDYVIMAILVLGAIPMVWEYLRHRHHDSPATSTAGKGRSDGDTAGVVVPHPDTRPTVTPTAPGVDGEEAG